MTIRETTLIKKGPYQFRQKKTWCFFSLIEVLFLLTFSSQLIAQQLSTISSDNFEEKKELAQPQPPENIEETTPIINTDEKQLATTLITKPIKEESNTAPETKSLVIKPVIVSLADFKVLEQKVTISQNQVEDLSLRILTLTQENQGLNNKLKTLQKLVKQSNQKQTVHKQTIKDKPNKRTKLKKQIIKLAIQTAQLKEESLEAKTKTTMKKEPQEKSAWYEKLVVVKKIESKPPLQEAKTPLYVVLKQFDLLQLTLEENNQKQWQSTIQAITQTLKNQFPNNALAIIEQLKTLQSQDIAMPELSKNTPVVDARFGIK